MRSSNVAATVARTRRAAPTTSSRSTSLPRTIGRVRFAWIATSRPPRIAAIIPVAAQANSTSVTSPTAPDGVAIPVIASATSARLVAVAGSARTIVSTTVSWTVWFPRMIPKIETRTMASGTIENNTR